MPVTPIEIFRSTAEWVRFLAEGNIVRDEGIHFRQTLRIPGDIRSLIPVISVHSVDGLMARS